MLGFELDRASGPSVRIDQEYVVKIPGQIFGGAQMVDGLADTYRWYLEAAERGALRF